MNANETTVRNAYKVAEEKDFAGWENCFTEDGWRVVSAAAAPVAAGMDVAVFDQGKIRALYVFLEEVR